MLISEFKLIDFGYSSAQMEGVRAPNLLLNGFLDINDICDTVLSGHEFLVLGYKGSGKSAIAERTRLLHQNNHSLFLQNIDLADFPYAAFSKIISDDEAPQARYPAAWSWLLLIYLISSLDRDAAKDIPNIKDFNVTIQALREIGLLPVMGLPQLIRTTTETTLKLSVPPFFEGVQSLGSTSVDVPYYVENIKRLLLNIRTPNRHLIILDGLDEIVTTQTAQWDSLGSLVYEVNRLNMAFSAAGLNAKVVLLCRTDIFELLDGANKNKIRQDSAIELDWYSNPARPEKSRLLSIANLRASIALGRKVDVFCEFLPEKSFKRKTTLELLDSTRHTPRDFLRLLHFIQISYGGESSASSDSNAIRNGLRRYSVEYFMPELIDELQGYVSSEEAKSFFKLAGALRQRDFSLRELLNLADAEGSNLSEDRIRTTLIALFECSGIGNIETDKIGSVWFQFRYRNRHAPFNIRQRMLLHRGLWRALNLPLDGSLRSSSTISQ